MPQRKNVFDNDDFDRLRISSKSIHKGRRDIKIDEPETAEEHDSRKAAIMAALSRFDSDDDERDDTYDVEDVGGTVDRSVDTDSRPRKERALEQNPHEEVLYRAWKDGAAMFARDSKTRVSPVRQDLKRQTGMSDEQIEGWAIMLARDSGLQNRLQQKYSAVGSFRGNQRNLEQTRWRHNASEENSMDEGEGQSSDTGIERGRGGAFFSNRGRGRGGPSFITPTGTPSQGGRGRGRGRGGGRANHNRREGRVRKMGRGMGGAPGAT
jgi:activating signal cointegrator complex subunit 2